MFPKFFTLSEARNALPTIRQLLEAANKDLERLAEDLEEANSRCHRLERKLLNSTIVEVIHKNHPDAQSSEDRTIRFDRKLADEEAQARFEISAHELASMQENYFKRLNYWIDKISDQGVILRDLQSGLLDFPARQGDLIYFLCWRLNDQDITYWHLPEDGLAGRRPLAVLIEYI